MRVYIYIYTHIRICIKQSTAAVTTTSVQSMCEPQCESSYSLFNALELCGCSCSGCSRLMSRRFMSSMSSLAVKIPEIAM